MSGRSSWKMALVFALGSSPSVVVSGCGHERAAETAPRPPDGETWLTLEQQAQANLVAEPVAIRAIGASIVAGGRMTFTDDKVSHVFSPVAGRVTHINAQLGQRVKKGDVLATVESPEISLASSDVGKAEAGFIAAEHDFNRKKELLDAHAGSKSDFDFAENNFQKAKAELSRAKQKAAQLRSGGGKVAGGYGLASFIDGEIIAKAVEPGMEVQGQYGAGGALELFTIGQVDTLWMLADVPEIDVPRVKPGAKVRVLAVSYPDRVFEGRVDWVSGALDPATRTAHIRCTLPNPEKLLKPEMYVTATITVDGRPALAVRRTSVQHMGDATVVYVEAGPAPNGGIKYERRRVIVDEEEEGDYVPVSRGLQPGDKVVSAHEILQQRS